MRFGSVARLAPLALAGILVGSAARMAGVVASRSGWRVEPADAWDADADDDPEPDIETLEAHARLVIANRAALGC